MIYGEIIIVEASGQDHAIDVARALDGFPAPFDILQNALGCALIRAAIAAASSVPAAHKFTRLQFKLHQIGQRGLVAIGAHLPLCRQLAVQPAAHAVCRIDLAVGRNDDGHRVLARAVNNFSRRSAAKSPSAAAGSTQAHAVEMNGVFDFAQLNAVAVHQAGDDRQAVCHPAIGLRTRRPAIDGGLELVDIGLTASPEIISGNDSEAGCHSAATLGQPVVISQLCEG